MNDFQSAVDKTVDFFCVLGIAIAIFIGAAVTICAGLVVTAFGYFLLFWKQTIALVVIILLLRHFW